MPVRLRRANIKMPELCEKLYTESTEQQIVGILLKISLCGNLKSLSSII